MLMPIFLFAAVLLVYTVKIMHFQEIVHFEAASNLVRLSWESQVGGDAFGKHLYESRTYNAVQSKVNKEININADVSEVDEVYIAEISYPILLDLPFDLYDDITLKDVLVARKWSGGDTSGVVLGFSAMEHEDDEDYKFIFPRYGERYHEVGCMYLSMDSGRYIECASLGEALSKGYSPCQVCH